MTFDNLGDRMKAYEAVPGVCLTRRMPMIIRVDGRAFHTYTKSMVKPWDSLMHHLMDKAAEALFSTVQGAKLAYIQSDEISLLAADYDTLTTEPWFGKKVQKMCSVAASVATAAFNAEAAKFPQQVKSKPATFDARCFVLPKEEVCNYFIWRQQDAVRNSIQSLGHHRLGHKEMQGKSCGQVQDMLHEKGANWNNCSTWQKRGWCLAKVQKGMLYDANIPTFSQDRNYVERHVL